MIRSTCNVVIINNPEQQKQPAADSTSNKKQFQILFLWFALTILSELVIAAK